MIKIYERIDPAVLLVFAFLLMFLATGIRLIRGLSFPSLNILFILIGLGAYFLPIRVSPNDSGYALRRKLLWVLFGAAALILGGDIYRAV